jgi:hypothetical protein
MTKELNVLEINLLPWREQRRRQWHKFRIIIAVVGLLLLAVLLWFYWPVHVSDADVAAVPAEPVPAMTVPQQLAGIKFVGILQQATRVWGILLCADGTTLDVHAGSKIPGIEARVSQMDAAELVLDLPHQQQYRLKMANGA